MDSYDFEQSLEEHLEVALHAIIQFHHNVTIYSSILPFSLSQQVLGSTGHHQVSYPAEIVILY
jgi:hypothetical protein